MMLRFTWIAMLFAPLPLLSDGGAVLAHRETEVYAITLFASPVPIRAGVVDVSLLLQQVETLQPVLDADVSIRFQSDESEIAVHASRDQAQNKLLYAANVHLDAPGEWRYSIDIGRGGAVSHLSGAITVAQAPPRLAGYWTYLALPPVCILIFVAHQYLSRKKSEIR